MRVSSDSASGHGAPVNASILYFQAPGEIQVRAEPVDPPAPGHLQVHTHVSAISPGTEMLFYRGQVPETMTVDATISGMDAPQAYPLRYGYACVGTVTATGDPAHSEWIGSRVFAFQPHGGAFNIPVHQALRIPDGLDEEAAVLFPNMETAVSLLHDAAPRLGERVLIFGQGIVGLLVTWLLSRAQYNHIITVDPLATRRTRSLNLGAVSSFPSADNPEIQDFDPDLILELSGNPAALESAVSLAGFQSRIIVGSWYGTKPVRLPLGHDFHRNRVSIYSSQVSTIDAGLAARWDKERRYAATWAQLQDLPYAGLITHRIPIDNAQDAYTLIAQRPEETCQVLLTYSA